jgi:serine protease AprX
MTIRHAIKNLQLLPIALQIIRKCGQPQPDSIAQKTAQNPIHLYYMQKLLYFIVLLLFALPAFCQYQRYVVQLKDKAGGPYTITNPGQYLSERALLRRQRAGIAIGTTDLPVNPGYLQALQGINGVVVLNTSKWFNQVAVAVTNTAAISPINNLPFVQSILATAPRSAQVRPPIKKNFNLPMASTAAPLQRPAGNNNYYNYGAAAAQIQLHQGEFLHNWGFSGQDMQIAVMDAGFSRYNSLSTFDSLLQQNRVLHTWDFVANKSTVAEEHPHGMHCLSTMAANMPGTFVGSSPAAGFYLYRTEDAGSEYPIEEHFFAVAAERADSAGADVFSVSLGYNQFDDAAFDYTYAQLDGNTTLIARAADMAAAKGIAVVVAAGNAGAGSWRYITTPADADSVLCVGAVNANGQVAGFSSYGPSADGQVKPDVAALGAGTAVASTSNGQPFFGNGTSYACPVMAGLATCLWQAFPEINNMALFAALRQSASSYSQPNNRIGYGLPNVKKAFVQLQQQSFLRQLPAINDCKLQWQAQIKAAAGMFIQIQRRHTNNSNFIAIDTLNAIGKFTSQTFSFADEWLVLTPTPNLQYRMVMHIGADTSYVIDSFTVSRPTICNSTGSGAITVMPNPVLEQAQVKVVSYLAGVQQWVLHNGLGQLVYKTSVQVLPGLQTVLLPMQKLPAGAYQLSCYQDGQLLHQKRIIKK